MHQAIVPRPSPFQTKPHTGSSLEVLRIRTHPVCSILMLWVRKGGMDNKLMSEREYYSIRTPIFILHIQLKHRPRLYLYTRQGDKWGKSEAPSNRVLCKPCHTQLMYPAPTAMGKQSEEPGSEQARQLEHDIYCFRQWAYTCCIFLFHIIKATTD